MGTIARLVLILGILGTIAFTILLLVMSMFFQALLALIIGIIASMLAAMPYFAICELYKKVEDLGTGVAGLDNIIRVNSRSRSAAPAVSAAPAASAASAAQADGNKPALSAAELINVALEYRSASGTQDYVTRNFHKLSKEDQAELAEVMNLRDANAVRELLIQKKEALG